MGRLETPKKHSFLFSLNYANNGYGRYLNARCRLYNIHNLNRVEAAMKKVLKPECSKELCPRGWRPGVSLGLATQQLFF